MGYGRGDCFPFDFEPKGNPFDSKSKGKQSPRPYPIQFERKWNTIFLSVPLQIPFSLFDATDAMCVIFFSLCVTVYLSQLCAIEYLPWLAIFCDIYIFFYKLVIV